MALIAWSPCLLMIWDWKWNNLSFALEFMVFWAIWSVSFGGRSSKGKDTLFEEAGSIMAMTRITLEEKKDREMKGGLDSMSGMTLSLLFICLKWRILRKPLCPPKALCVGKGFLFEVKHVIKGWHARFYSEVMANQMELEFLYVIFDSKNLFESRVIMNF